MKPIEVAYAIAGTMGFALGFYPIIVSIISGSKDFEPIILGLGLFIIGLCCIVLGEIYSLKYQIRELNEQKE